MNSIFLSALAVGVSTLFGSLLGFFIKNVSHKTNDVIIGFSAGLMLAAAVLGLLQPAFSGVSGWELIIPLAGVFAGALLLDYLDLITPHLHSLTGLDAEEHRNNHRLNRVLLFVMAIALHKFPEGMAAGVGFGGPDMQDAMNVTIAISLQNIPEAMVIISPLLLVGVGRMRTLGIALGIGLLEVAGVFVGYLLGSVSESFLPFMLALSGGAMLYVVSDEMIPESHSHGFQKLSTFALLAGFVAMMMIERL